jgi:GNAT superfamily N-acetyltransferase
MRALRTHYDDEAEFVRRVDQVQRPEGYGRALLEWCGDEARRLGCDQIHLDSGVEANRLDAHRLYLNTGMRITSFHFAKPLR